MTTNNLSPEEVSEAVNMAVWEAADDAVNNAVFGPVRVSVSVSVSRSVDDALRWGVDQTVEGISLQPHPFLGPFDEKIQRAWGES